MDGVGWCLSGVPGQEMRSNSRIIRWSDGSASLQVGQEIWDIDLPAGNPSKPFSSKAEQAKIPKPTTTTKDGSLSVLYGTEFDEKVLFADRVVNGYLGLIPATPNVRNHQKRLQALSGDSVKQAKIRSYHDKSGIAPDKQAEMEVKRIQEQQRRALVEKGVRYTGAMTSWRPGAAVIGSRGSSPRKSRAPGASGGRARGGRGLSSEDEGYDVETRPGAKYRGGDGGYEKDDFVVDDEEDDDDFLSGGDKPKKKSKNDKTKRSRDFSDDEDEDEDEEDEEASAEESEGEASELEQAERDAERALKQREKAKREQRVRDAPTAAVPGEYPICLSTLQVLMRVVDDVSDTEMAETAPAKKRKVMVEEDEDDDE